MTLFKKYFIKLLLIYDELNTDYREIIELLQKLYNTFSFLLSEHLTIAKLQEWNRRAEKRLNLLKELKEKMNEYET